MNGDKIRVLYVDDNPFDRELVRDALTHYRPAGAPDASIYDLTEAASQIEFEEKLADGPYDIVLTDFNILGFDGLQVLSRVRRAWSGVPVIVVTGTGSEEVAVSAMKLGAADYIIKSTHAIERLPLAIGATLRARNETVARIAAEYSLAESEARFRRAVEEAPVPIVIHADDGEILAISEAWLSISGYDRRQVPTMQAWLGLSRDDDRARVAAEIEQSFAESEAHHIGEYPIRCADGRIRVWDFSSTPLGMLPDERRCAIRIANDVTERIELETQLRLAQKMEAIGRLAGGVAHDFNNMLQVITGYAALAADEFKDRDEPPVWLAMIGEAVRRSANLTRQLLAFARSQATTPSRVELPDALAGMARLLRRLLSEEISLDVECDPDTWPVSIDPTELDSIIANLVINARDALPGAGTISILSGNRMVDAAHAERNSVEPGEFALLRVRDTGVGMDRETLERIYEPFFTTKPRGIGTGLGLPTVYGAVKHSGGFIEVESEPGHGTTFSVFLPRLVAHGDPAASAPSSRSFVGRGVALLIEDDATVRGSGEQLLSRIGYHVAATGDPLHAIELVGGGIENLAVVISDVVMPTMSGVDLVRRLRDLVPGLPAVLISGYPMGATDVFDPDDASVCFLAKPFDQEGLARSIAAAMPGELEIP